MSRRRLGQLLLVLGLVVLAALAVGVVVALRTPHGSRPGLPSASSAAAPTSRPSPTKSGAKPSPSPTSSLGVVPTPSAITSQLTRFLSVYYTRRSGETDAQWTQSIKAVTSPQAWPEVQPTIAGLPAGWTSSGNPYSDKVVTQNQHTPGELYVEMPVAVTVTDTSGTTQTFGYYTGSEWERINGQWTMLTFAGAPVGGGSP
jgi:hypothetical protein